MFAITSKRTKIGSNEYKYLPIPNFTAVLLSELDNPPLTDSMSVFSLPEPPWLLSEGEFCDVLIVSCKY